MVQARGRRASGSRIRPSVRGSVVGLVLALVAGCAVQPLEPAVARAVEVADDELVLRVGPSTRTLTSLDEAAGTPVHAALRPGVHDEDTVVVLSRLEGDPWPRYELGYLVATDDAVTELYGFPGRMQVAEELPAILDVAPVPVWAPDGSAIAWIEWVGAGTRLRTVGWIDEGETRNPSEDGAAYALDDVPAGVQLEDWVLDDDGGAVLLGRDAQRAYRIRLALDDAPRDEVPAGLTAGR